jgi:DNA-binding GntR family transcriptional regulator
MIEGGFMKGINKNSLQNIRPFGGDGNLTRMVYEQIREMMENYEIIPGQRLIFVDLAKRLGVSRTPVNNALSILAHEGFLDFVPNQGYTVHQITEEEAESLYEIREIIELGSIGQTIRKLTPEKLDTLKRRKELYEKAVADQVSRGRFLLDQEFHACHVHLCENLYLAEYFREVYQRIFLRHRIEGLRADRAHAVVTEHDEIFEAIKLKDVEWAKESIKSHLASGKQYIFSVIFGERGIDLYDERS